MLFVSQKLVFAIALKMNEISFGFVPSTKENT